MNSAVLLCSNSGCNLLLKPVHDNVCEGKLRDWDQEQDESDRVFLA